MSAAGYNVEVNDWQMESVVTDVRGSISKDACGASPARDTALLKGEVMDLRANSCHGVVLFAEYQLPRGPITVLLLHNRAVFGVLG
jgi:hypothetical protein